MKHIQQKCEETNSGGILIEMLVPGGATEALKEIIGDHLLTWADLFAEKNAGYGNMADDLGSRAQYVDINRKVMKLRRALWDGQDIGAEDVQEVINDLIGHCFLMLVQLRREASVAAHPSSLGPAMAVVRGLPEAT